MYDGMGHPVENFEEDLRELNTCNLGNIKREKVGRKLEVTGISHQFLSILRYFVSML